MKRVFDIGLVLLGLPIVVPLVVLVMLLVRLKLGTPVFFTQVRPGKLGRPFMLIKFRTMTDARTADGSLRPDAERLTSFGRFLRASSLDELPELWNVLCGEMSLVGPRPLPIRDFLQLDPEDARPSRTLRRKLMEDASGMYLAGQVISPIALSSQRICART